MSVELTLWRPLWEFSAVLFVMGLAASLIGRDRGAWLIAQGVMLLAVVTGFTAVQATHAGVDLFPLAAWVPLAWLPTLFVWFFNRPADEESA